MAGISIQFRVVVDIGTIENYAPEKIKKIDTHIEKTAFEFEQNAKMLAPVDTGALRASIKAEPKYFLMWTIHDGVEYGIYQELGTYKMAAHPFFTPTIHKLWRPFIEGFYRVFGT